ncbi:ATP-binding protein [Algimonas porphyrae]|uniref:ATP-binding protein n=1 Tax=Algimonas porphyrae TaxID=1128113 RepID=UPI00352AA987
MSPPNSLKQATAPSAGTRRWQGQIEVGQILTVASSEVVISLNKTIIRDNKLHLAQIGTILKILTSDSIVVAMVSSLEIGATDDDGLNDGCMAKLNILGEITTNPTTRETKFFRGVRTYPVLNEAVYTMSPSDLQLIFARERSECIDIGRLQQDGSIVAKVRTDDMLSKHFAIIGSTGSGKSCTVALVLQAILRSNPAGHIVLFDPHNEYSKSFGDLAEVITGETLDLPIWMFDFVETVELLTSEIEEHAREEEEILHDAILKAKRLFERAMQRGEITSQVKLDDIEHELQRASHISLDSPVPYRIRDVVKLIHHDMGKLENNSNLQPYKRLKRRIEMLIADPRYAFIFRNQAKPQALESIMGRIFRLPVNGKPISILDFSSIPSETLNVVVSVVSRLAFELASWSERQIPILLVCEEAHRYIPRDPKLGFHATRRIISRIAKEGRKYGVSLGIISQRPSELEPSTLSQCSTIFSMRLTNEVDQNFVRAAVPDGATELLTFLPSLGTAEAMVFGEAVNLPMRVLLNNLPEEYRPHSSSASFSQLWRRDTSTPELMAKVYGSWKSRSRNPEHHQTAPVPTQPAPGQVQGQPHHSQGHIPVAQHQGAPVRPTTPAHPNSKAQALSDVRNLLNAAFHRDS